MIFALRKHLSRAGVELLRAGTAQPLKRNRLTDVIWRLFPAASARQSAVRSSGLLRTFFAEIR
jgi:hypothetical protein